VGEVQYVKFSPRVLIRTAVIYVNDLMAIGALRELREQITPASCKEKDDHRTGRRAGFTVSQLSWRAEPCEVPANGSGASLPLTASTWQWNRT
jgi:hypothetical protein